MAPELARWDFGLPSPPSSPLLSSPQRRGTWTHIPVSLSLFSFAWKLTGKAGCPGPTRSSMMPSWLGLALRDASLPITSPKIREKSFFWSRQTGLLVLGKKEEAEIRTIQDNLSKQGAEHKYFDAEELRRCFPNIRFPREQVGIWEPHAGVLFADKALKALQDLIRQLGGVIHDGEKVVEIKPGYPVTVTTATRTYQAKSLVITAGPWTNQLLLPLGMQLPLQALRINVCYWREKVPGSYGKNFPCFIGSFPDLAPHHIYGLPAREYPGLVKVCYHHGNKADPDERDCPSASSEVADVQILSSFVRDYLPSLQPRPAIMERCMYTNTPDQNFILDRHPKHANIVIGAGFSGHGFKLSPVVGKVLYELSTGSTLSYDPTPFQIRRFQGLNNASL
ncbi:peroxisomal sarcosine oxidase isoform X3 [Dromiciops gliroides]|uniref:peroxisomal sarcosine oxidase isoform X3 n=1 Tax=Dromiciops gliroides TaxID=33562 RepID=UPI001CC69C19|nr:peroxisomal sarcosine oxidase isoform X3 [Dromiciops gliroides]